MNIAHDFHDHHSLDSLILGVYIYYQSFGRLGHGQLKAIVRTRHRKESIMPSHGYTTTWGTHIRIGRPRDAKS
jgi:hypothetical protein